MLAKSAIIFCALFSVAVGSTYTCPDGWVDILFKCYYFSNETAGNFYAALRNCDNAGSYLTSIESKLEHNNVVGYINSIGATEQAGWWISGSNNLRDRSFGWFGTGRSMIYKNFCNGSEDGSSDHCVTLDPNCDFAWSIVPCKAENAYYYICEKDITVS